MSYSRRVVRRRVVRRRVVRRVFAMTCVGCFVGRSLALSTVSLRRERERDLMKLGVVLPPANSQQPTAVTTPTALLPTSAECRVPSAESDPRARGPRRPPDGDVRILILLALAPIVPSDTMTRRPNYCRSRRDRQLL
jgi:hypothetical protein